ncbi:hypothetical protein BMB171_C3038 [Bacillus thuringiensis BMB171]|nr:hypothetical protein BMB171_C3038 [Bacillus thuringiensis BMB171]
MSTLETSWASYTLLSCITNNSLYSLCSCCPSGTLYPPDTLRTLGPSCSRRSSHPCRTNRTFMPSSWTDWTTITCRTRCSYKRKRQCHSKFFALSMMTHNNPPSPK